MVTAACICYMANLSGEFSSGSRMMLNSCSSEDTQKHFQSNYELVCRVQMYSKLYFSYHL